MKYSQQQKDKIQKIIAEINDQYDQLENQKESQTTELRTLKNELNANSEKLSWKEKLFGGSLGGNKELAEKVKRSELKKEKIEKSIITLNEKLDGRTDRIRKEFTNALKSIDQDFAKLTSDRSLHFELYQASKKYEELLKKAQQGVIDALLFLSWEKLINHPEASEKLSDFKKETRRLQKTIDTLRENSSSQPDTAPILSDLIKFNSQEVAMSSFKKLLKQTTFYKKYADKYLTNSKTKIQKYRNVAYKNIIG